MPPQEFDGEAQKQLAVVKVTAVLAGLAFFAALGGFYLWRIHHFPRAVATIEAIQEKTVHRRGEIVVTVAVLSFTRISSAGASIACKYPFEIGLPSDGFKVGDRMEIIPDSGGCERIDIIGKAKPTS